MNENYLAHYGIKRRSGRYPYGSGVRPFQSEKLVKGTKRSKIYRNEHVIPKGTKVYQTDRIGKNVYSGKTERVMNPSNSVNYLKPDRDRSNSYSSVDERANIKKIERTMELTEDVKVPSRQHLKQTINDLIEKDPKLLDESIEALTKYNNTNFDGSTIAEEELNQLTKSSIDHVKNLSLDDRFTWYVESFDSENPLKKAVTNQLKSEGYNGMVNEYGVGSFKNKATGADSIYLFDLKETTKKISQKELTKEEQLNAAGDYYKWVRKARNNKVW